MSNHNDQQTFHDDRDIASGPSTRWASVATAARAEHWASDGTLDPGDTHDKGEASLCVGEAA